MPFIKLIYRERRENTITPTLLNSPKPRGARRPHLWRAFIFAPIMSLILAAHHLTPYTRHKKERPAPRRAQRRLLPGLFKETLFNRKRFSPNGFLLKPRDFCSRILSVSRSERDSARTLIFVTSKGDTGTTRRLHPTFTFLMEGSPH